MLAPRPTLLQNQINTINNLCVCAARSRACYLLLISSSTDKSDNHRLLWLLRKLSMRHRDRQLPSEVWPNAELEALLPLSLAKTAMLSSLTILDPTTRTQSSQLHVCSRPDCHHLSLDARKVDHSRRRKLMNTMRSMTCCPLEESLVSGCLEATRDSLNCLALSRAQSLPRIWLILVRNEKSLAILQLESPRRILSQAQTQIQA